MRLTTNKPQWRHATFILKNQPLIHKIACTTETAAMCSDDNRSWTFEIWVWNVLDSNTITSMSCISNSSHKAQTLNIHNNTRHFTFPSSDQNKHFARRLSIAFLMLSQLLTCCPSDALASGLVKDRRSGRPWLKWSQAGLCYSCPLWHTHTYTHTPA